MNSFPFDEVSEKKYSTVFNIMYVLYNINKTKFLEYCEILKEKCDKMSAHRLQVIINEFEK